MPGVFYLTHIFKLNMVGFDDQPFALQNLIVKLHQIIFHGIMDLNNQMYSIGKQQVG